MFCSDENLSLSENKKESYYITDKFKRRECNKFVPAAENRVDRCKCGHDSKDHSRDCFTGGHDHEEPWDANTDTITAETNAYGEINFMGAENDILPLYLRCEIDTKVSDIAELFLSKWNMPQPLLLISVFGGHSKFDAAVIESLMDIKNGLVNAAKSTKAWLFTSGVNHGVSNLVGDAVAMKRSFIDSIPIIGVNSWGAVADNHDLVHPNGLFPAHYHNRTLSQMERDHLGKPTTMALEHEHTHFVLLDKGTRYNFHENEVRAYRINLQQELVKRTQAQLVSVLVEGGVGSLNEAKMRVQAGLPLVVIGDSGRVSDVLCAAYELAIPLDIATGEGTKKVREFGCDEDRREIRGLLRRALPHKDETQYNELMAILEDVIREDELITIWRVGRGEELDKTILRGLIKSLTVKVSHPDQDVCLLQDRSETLVRRVEQQQSIGKELLKRQLELAIQWNRLDIATEYIFSNMTLEESELNEMLSLAILHRQQSFIDNIIERGAKIKSYLTEKRFEEMLNRTPPNTYLYKLLVKMCRKKVRPYFLYEHFQQVVHHISDGVYHAPEKRVPSTNLQECAGDPTRTEIMLDSIRICGPGTKNGNGNTYRYIARDAWEEEEEANGDSQPEHRHLKYDFEDPEHLLVVYFTLIHEQEMALHFWKYSRTPLYLGLVCSHINSWMKSKEKFSVEITDALAAKLVTYSEEFEYCALQILEEAASYPASYHFVEDLITYEYTKWGKVSALELADYTNAVSLIAHASVQDYVDMKWNGWLDADITVFRILISLPLPFLASFRSIQPRDTEKSLIKKPKKLEAGVTKERLAKMSRRQSFIGSITPEDMQQSKQKKLPFLTKCKYFYKAPVTKFYIYMITYVGFLFAYMCALLVKARPADCSNNYTINGDVDWVFYQESGETWIADSVSRSGWWFNYALTSGTYYSFNGTFSGMISGMIDNKIDGMINGTIDGWWSNAINDSWAPPGFAPKGNIFTFNNTINGTIIGAITGKFGEANNRQLNGTINGDIYGTMLSGTITGSTVQICNSTCGFLKNLLFGCRLTLAEMIVYLFVFALIPLEARQVYFSYPTTLRGKIRGYLSSIYNKNDILCTTLILMALGFRYWGGVLPDRLDYDKVLDWRENMFRLCFAMAFLLYVMRVCQALQIDSQLGPKVMMMQRMLVDLMFFINLVAVILIGYGVTTAAIINPGKSDRLSFEMIFDLIWRPYVNLFGEFSNDDMLAEMAGYYCEYTHETGKFWRNETKEHQITRWGYTWVETYEEETEYTCDGSEGVSYDCSQDGNSLCVLNQYVVQILLAVYMMLAAVLMLNLLVAVFSSTYTNIEDRSETLWKRQKFDLMQEFQDRSILPIPISTFLYLYRFAMWIFYKTLGRFCCKRQKEEKVEVDEHERVKIALLESECRRNYLDKHQVKISDSVVQAEMIKRVIGDVEKIDSKLKSFETSIQNVLDSSMARPSPRDRNSTRDSGTDRSSYGIDEVEADAMLLEEKDLSEEDFLTVQAGEKMVDMAVLDQEEGLKIEKWSPAPTESSDSRKSSLAGMKQAEADLDHLLKLGKRSRRPEYPESKIIRAVVKKEHWDWRRPLLKYKPSPFTDGQLDLKPSDIVWNDNVNGDERRSYEGKYRVQNNLPLNLCGRTGLSGRGKLARWGPNHCSMPIITRCALDEQGEVETFGGKPILEVMMDCSVEDVLALPETRGIRDDPLPNKIRYFFSDQNMNCDPAKAVKLLKRIDKIFKTGSVVKKGFLDSEYNTDNAWLETLVVSYHDYHSNAFCDIDFPENSPYRWTKIKSWGVVRSADRDCIQKALFARNGYDCASAPHDRRISHMQGG